MLHAGTHNVEDANVTELSRWTTVSVRYKPYCNAYAMGALMNFIHITEEGDVDFTKSILLTVNRNHSLSPILLPTGHYRVLFYDIEHDGILPSGVIYPAIIRELHASGTNQGN